MVEVKAEPGDITVWLRSKPRNIKSSRFELVLLVGVGQVIHRQPPYDNRVRTPPRYDAASVIRLTTSVA